VAAGAWSQRGAAANPQQLNRYSYVLNNPVRNVDPSGHWVFSIGIQVAGGAGVGGSATVGWFIDTQGNSGFFATPSVGNTLGGGAAVSTVGAVSTAESYKEASGSGFILGVDAPGPLGSVDIGFITNDQGVPTGPVSISAGTGFGPMLDVHLHGTYTTFMLMSCQSGPSCPITPDTNIRPAPTPLPEERRESLPHTTPTPTAKRP
jgi:hypothetical protein